MTKMTAKQPVTGIVVALALISVLALFSFPSHAHLQSTSVIADSFDFPLGAPNGTGYGPYPTTDYNVQNPALSGYKECFGVDWSQLWHAGEDWFENGNPGGTAGDTITAIANGQVKFADPNYNYKPGRVVIIQHEFPDTNDVVYSMYGHLQNVYVTVDQEVTRGQAIGTVYNQSSNSHLHWEIRSFLDGSFICAKSGIPGPGYTYPEHPDFPISGDFYTGYTDPTDFINYSEITDQVILFQHSYYRGFTFKVFDAGFYNLSVLLNDKASSIAIPNAWSAMVYKHANGDGGAGEKRTLYWNDVDFSNNQFFDGTPLNDEISAIEVFVPSPPPCPRHTEGDVDCDGIVGVLDLQHIINVILGIGSPFDTDVYPDGLTTVLDLQVVINTIIGQTQNIQTSAAASATLSISSANVNPGEQGAVTISLNSTPGREVGALSLYINFNPTIIDIQSADINLSDTPFEQWDIQSAPITVSNGLIQIVAFCFNSCADYSGGSTSVAIINFIAIGSRGSSTDLVFVEDFGANQANVIGANNPIANLLQEPGSTTNNGRVTISSRIYLPIVLKSS